MGYRRYFNSVSMKGSSLRGRSNRPSGEGRRHGSLDDVTSTVPVRVSVTDLCRNPMISDR